MSFSFKKFFKKNTRNPLFKGLSSFGLAVNRFYENKNYDIQSNGELNVLQKLKITNPNYIFDVGANVGDYAVLVHKVCPGSQIFAFEPINEPFQKLAKTVKNNMKVKAFQLALSEHQGKKKFFLYDQSELTSSVNILGMNREISQEYQINVVNGDRFMKEHKIESIDLLKIDVEGAEMDVIKGFWKAFTEKRIRVCQFEYGYANITSHALLLDFYLFLGRHGYRIGKIYPKYVEFRDYHVKQEDFLGPNYLAVDESDIELIKLLSK